jgi:hypothetical protein
MVTTICGFLGTVVRLESLYLAFVPRRRAISQHHQDIQSEMFRANSFHALTTLHLNGIRLKTSILRQGLEACQSKLETLWLFEVLLLTNDGGGWQSLLEYAQQMLRLKDIDLTDLKEYGLCRGECCKIVSMVSRQPDGTESELDRWECGDLAGIRAGLKLIVDHGLRYRDYKR